MARKRLISLVGRIVGHGESMSTNSVQISANNMTSAWRKV